MTKRKYKVFVRYTLLMLCLFPLLLIMINCLAEGANLNDLDVNAIIDKFVISETLVAQIKDVLPSFGFAFDGAFADAVPIIIANTLIIYIMYIVVEVLLIIPKLSVDLIQMVNIGGKNE